jgi:hypothetical protein
MKYFNIYRSKALQNLPKLVFLFENKPSGNPGHVSLVFLEKLEWRNYWPGLAPKVHRSLAKVEVFF